MDLSKIVYLPSTLVDTERYSVREGDILFNNTNSMELVGRAAVVRQDLLCGFSNHITRLRVKADIALPEWLASAINKLWLDGHFLRTSTKWIGQAGVNTAKLKALKIGVPFRDGRPDSRSKNASW